MMLAGGGSSGGGRRRLAAQADINVTPLIDIVLVLLIVFMVLTPVALKQLVATVPQTETHIAPQPAGDDPIVVSVAADGAVLLDGRPVDDVGLAAKVAERLRHDRRRVVFFRIDDRTSYGRAVEIMDACRGAGAATLALLGPS
jgi:biopolymer transport protein ExbD